MLYLQKSSDFAEEHRDIEAVAFREKILGKEQTAISGLMCGPSMWSAVFGSLQLLFRAQTPYFLT